MVNKVDTPLGRLVVKLASHVCSFLFRVLSVGPVPDHIAFILDGNRRYARTRGLDDGMGHRAGFVALMTLLMYSYMLGVRHVTVYAFSIDNFKRRPHEVDRLMNLILEKIESFLDEDSIINKYGVRVVFVGNLRLLDEPVRAAAERTMRATAGNRKYVLIVCMAYTSTHEIVQAAHRSCEEAAAANGGGGGGPHVRVADLERWMYLGFAPDVDILVRSSGETRLSNFLTWQSTSSILYSPRALWPEIGLRHLVKAVLEFQRLSNYLEKRRKQL